jgi:hypothetical protein
MIVSRRDVYYEAGAKLTVVAGVEPVKILGGFECF